MPERKRKKGRGLRNFFIGLLLVAGVFTGYFIWDTKLVPPEVADKSILNNKRQNPAPGFYVFDNNRLKKNKYGLWEMYLEGNPFEMGVANGKLTRELIKIQEDAFVEQISELVPSPAWLKFLKYFIAWFNRDIDENISPEYQREIYGVSFSAADGYEYIGSNYERMLNYHAAHDIGHALKDLALVGCTSFATNLHHADNTLIVGRNFDFFVNDDFARNKIVAFVAPEKGHKFMYITWASMIGVVSGMNEKGLTVTINAAKSDIPGSAATPISILAREILQYAGNIKEAIAISKKRKTFVSESILIGSAADNDAVIIEKSPAKQGLFTTTKGFMVCANHFQSETFSMDKNNLEYMEESASTYRQQRCEQLLLESDSIGYLRSAAILRDHKGLDGENIGIGNEKTMAQMISHHSMIFMPKKLEVWISTSPYQLGKYLAYKLDDVFSSFPLLSSPGQLYDTLFTIDEDPFLHSSAYTDFIAYRKLRKQLGKHIEEKSRIDREDEFIKQFTRLNPGYFEGFMLAGNYYYNLGEYEKAKRFYTVAMGKEFENLAFQRMVRNRLKELKSRNK
ncbi:MAG: C45 family peptidase [Bacteroidales bacterium]|nr:C45 family peptidase [Bacteroidales bacterium]